jgi:hypothetical protein
MTLSRVHNLGKWNWEGDEIVHEPIIPHARKIPGSKKDYELDIREFLLGPDNAIIRRELKAIVDSLSPGERMLFQSRRPRSFDLRMREVCSYVSKKITYTEGKRTFDTWLYPDETLQARAGDCEDRAFVLAALLLASGISRYNVRVALGKLYDARERASRDHVWVMYKNEDSLWMCIEPLVCSPTGRVTAKKLGVKTRQKWSPRTLEYVPYFVFNRDHLWRIKQNTSDTGLKAYLATRKFWRRFDPAFATSVHNQLIDTVFEKMGWGTRFYLKSYSLALDTVDTYIPAEHFDNGYIEEGWALVNANIAQKTLNGLATALHSIADFYAHSSYAHFARRSSQQLKLFDGEPDFTADYRDASFNVGDAARFSVNTALYTDADRDRAVKVCNDLQIVSGRFAQPGDSSQSWLERAFVEIPYELRRAPDFAKRASFPHHDEIAVDGPLDDGKVPGKHRLYATAEDYREQFELRYDAARRHMELLHKQWEAARRGVQDPL